MRRHRTDALSLLFGLVFLLVAAWWGVGHAVHLGLDTLGWAIAVLLIMLGALGLLGVLRGRDQTGRDEAGHDADRGDDGWRTG